MNFVDCRLENEGGQFYTVAAGMKLRLPDERAAKLAGSAGKEMVLGIRPEYISHAPGGQESQSRTRFRGSVCMVELLGSEKLVHIRIGESTLIARLAPRVPLKLGDVADFEVNTDLVHVFTRDTEMAIL